MAILIRRQLNYAAVATGFFLGRVIFIIENMHAALSAKTPPRIHSETLLSLSPMEITHFHDTHDKMFH